MKRLILLSWTVFLVITLTADNARASYTTDVKKVGSLYMESAAQLVGKNTCKSLGLAKEMVQAYESLRVRHPNELPSRSEALAEVDDHLRRHCTKTDANQKTVFVYSSGPIATGPAGGFNCAKCNGVPDGDFRELPGFLPSCVGCPARDLIALAVLYMNSEQKTTILGTLDPTMKATIVDFVDANPGVVRQIQDTIRINNIDAAPIMPGQINPPTNNPIKVPAMTPSSVIKNPSP